MLNSYIKNVGLTKTFVYDNNKHKEINELNWDAKYDGNIANISITSNNEGDKKQYEFILDNEALENILNIPTVNIPLEKRLKMDFKRNRISESNIKRVKFNNTRTPKIITIKPRLNKSNSIIKSLKYKDYLSSPLPKEELIVPGVDTYILTPEKRHKNKKTRKIYKIYKRLKTKQKTHKNL